MEQNFLKVRPTLEKLGTRESYVVPSEAGQSLVALAVAVADDCVVVEVCGDGVVDCEGGGVVDCEDELGYIITISFPRGA